MTDREPYDLKGKHPVINAATIGGFWGLILATIVTTTWWFMAVAVGLLIVAVLLIVALDVAAESRR